jgi:hypothetical protein
MESFLSLRFQICGRLQSRCWICSKLKFCEKEPTDAKKIEKTLSTMLSSDRVLQ